MSLDGYYAGPDDNVTVLELPTSELTELKPPNSWAVRGIDGAIRGNVKGTAEPLEAGARARVTIALGFEAHGIGKLLLPLALVARRQAQSEMPRNLHRLQEQLESAARQS